MTSRFRLAACGLVAAALVAGACGPGKDNADTPSKSDGGVSTSSLPDCPVDAFTKASGKTEVICMATPVPFAKMTEDLTALNTEEGQKVLEKQQTAINGVQGLLLLLEFAPMAGEDTEVMYTLMFARPFEGASLVLNAQYPKSQHERLYPKLLAAFGTVRKKDN